MTIRREAGDLATIFGGSGFVGRHTVRALARDGWRVRSACRRPDLAGHLQPLGNVGQIHAVQANVRYPDSVARALEGSAAVVNLVAIMTPGGAQTYKAVHVEGAQAIARAAKAAGVGRFVHVSALGADAASPSVYASSKAEGEAAVLAEFPEAIILRPSIVFGPEDQFYNRFASLARLSPIVPVLGGGRTKMQPVYVGDLARAIANAAAGAGQPGTIYEIGGPEVQSFRTIMEDTSRWAGRQSGFVNVPFWMIKIPALAMSILPNMLRPITPDQVRLLQLDNVVSAEAEAEGRTLAALGVAQPQAAAAVVPGYLERFKPRGQYSHYRG
jgi:NADH dehydrogenase